MRTHGEAGKAPRGPNLIERFQRKAKPRIPFVKMVSRFVKFVVRFLNHCEIGDQNVMQSTTFPMRLTCSKNRAKSAIPPLACSQS
jgi:hypothetical protein